jgi:hypothetical protein
LASLDERRALRAYNVKKFFGSFCPIGFFLVLDNISDDGKRKDDERDKYFDVPLKPDQRLREELRCSTSGIVLA